MVILWMFLKIYKLLNISMFQHTSIHIKTIIFGLAGTLASNLLMAQEDLAEKFPLDERPIDRADTPMLTSYANQLENIQEAVVAVYTANRVTVNRRGSDPFEDMLRRFYGIPAPERDDNENDEDEERLQSVGQGSGVIISSDGYILTNNHVISDRQGDEVDEVYVSLGDDVEYEAEIIGTDPKTDIALLKIESDDPLPYANMTDSDNLRIGDIVFAIGNPLGVGKTVTMGIVSAKSRRIGLLGQQAYESFIQTDASINVGNSGGALVDAEGRLVGINTAIVSQSGGNIGIGFAVPIKLARSIMVSLLTDGEIRRGLLGVEITGLDQDTAESFGLEDTRGALVNTVMENLPAEKAGIEYGDIIIRVNGKEIEDDADLRFTIASYRPGETIDVTFIRDGEEQTVSVTLSDIDDPFGTGLSSVDQIIPGVSVTTLDDNLREQYGIPDDLDGLIIEDVDVDSGLTRSLSEGMLIIEINGNPVNTVREARDALRSGINRLYVYRRGNYGFVAVRM